MLVARYLTKKKLKESTGKHLHYEETSIYGDEYRPNGILTVVGPSAYKRVWYAQVTMKDNLIHKVK